MPREKKTQQEKEEGKRSGRGDEMSLSQSGSRLGRNATRLSQARGATFQHTRGRGRGRTIKLSDGEVACDVADGSRQKEVNQHEDEAGKQHFVVSHAVGEPVKGREEQQDAQVADKEDTGGRTVEREPGQSEEEAIEAEPDGRAASDGEGSPMPAVFLGTEGEVCREECAG